MNEHQPVLLDEGLKQLVVRPDGIYLDATFGRGGHARAILASLSPAGRLIALDRDPEAVAFARQTEEFAADPRFSIEHAAFDTLQSVVEKYGVAGKLQGILFDLGVSSPQLDNPARGFSFMQEGPLDMRMDPTQGLSAAQWLAEAEEKEIATVLWRYGEERHSRKIARAIVAARADAPVLTTTRLAAIIARAMPSFQKGKHPATRSFQGIRIFINGELARLETALAAGLATLAPYGRLAVISFHSLEDRIVKQFMRSKAISHEFPPGLPVKQTTLPGQFRCVGRAIRPDAGEIALNPRARSAILRTGEKLP